ncbi:MAG: beta-ketoacyl-[acyl-carrier-protein] synthase family protein [Chitinophagaceae bacterium]|nr:beta-ketoacyl-[acyl-carrier-protein] synthase family protein [Chitinophagaceae bacterium]MCW5927627.1 beta-ketoacyl-[acyl-carrier-protein] synthase family protein [Chitinophagaceae bacterium]
MSEIVVTGIGVISAVGNNAEENRQALINGKGGISDLSLFETHYAGLRPCGEIKTDTQTLKTSLDANEPEVTRTSLLALYAFLEAISDAGLTQELLSESDTALVGASTVGGMCLTDELYHDANRDSNGSPYLSEYDYASAAIYLQKRFNIGGIVNTINTACSSSANAIMYGARLLKHGFCKRVIAGGADSLAKFTINGFNALHILSPAQCTPFDRDRNGLNLGEGAAFIVLEKEIDAKHKRRYARLTGYGNSNDAFHPSSLSDNGVGPQLAMRQALSVAGLEPDAVDFINAHGTATENNDLVESEAMRQVFGTVPAFMSAKAHTGHTLGAAGALGALYGILGLYHQEVYPAIHFTHPIESTGLVPSEAYRPMSLRNVMANSFGFGGNCSSLIFSAL